MSYIIIAVSETTVTIWDGKTKDPDHPGEKAGTMEIHIGPHVFQEGDRVTLIVRRLVPNGI